MSSFSKASSSKSQNQFVASLRSRKTDNGVTWINPMDSYIRSLFAKDIKEVTAKEFTDKIGTRFDNELYYLYVVDTTVPQVAVSADDY